MDNLIEIWDINKWFCGKLLGRHKMQITNYN